MPSPTQNLLLEALPAKDRERLLPELQLVRAALGSVLYDAGARIHHVFFPVEGIVSLLHITRTGKSTELAVIGRDGMVGASLFLGGETTPNQAVVQSAAVLYRLHGPRLVEAFAEGGALQLILLKYTQSLLRQISQTAVCNRHHTLEQRLCRWLLLSLDRLPHNKLQMTHDMIATMLGVRRQGVTEAAGRLEARHIVEYSRGLVTVLDRAKLEARACECYAAVRDAAADWIETGPRRRPLER